MYYVTMTDKFLSGWGGAQGRTSKFVIECTTYDEAKIVAENAQGRGEMKRINIVTKKPYYSPKNYHVSIGDKSSCSRWFIPNAF